MECAAEEMPGKFADAVYYAIKLQNHHVTEVTKGRPEKLSILAEQQEEK